MLKVMNDDSIRQSRKDMPSRETAASKLDSQHGHTMAS